MPKEDLINPTSFDPDRIELGKDRIRQMNPQRFEMEQLDGILHFDGPKKLIVGVKYVGADEWWTRGHIPGRPVYPAVLMLEAAAQLGTVYLHLAHPANHGFWGFGGIDEVRFRGVVQPGDKLILAVNALDVRTRFCKFVFQGFVAGRRVVEGSVLGMLLGDTGSRS